MSNPIYGKLTFEILSNVPFAKVVALCDSVHFSQIMTGTVIEIGCIQHEFSPFKTSPFNCRP